MIKNIFISLIPVAAGLVVNIINKNKISFLTYLYIFLITLFGCTIISNSIHAAEKYSSRRVYRFLTNVQYSDFTEKKKFHEEYAKLAFAEAKSRCWWAPDLEERALARNCFTVAMSSIPANTPQSKMVTMIISSLTIYGLACLEEWEYIEHKFNCAEYHWNLAEFYDEVLKKG